MAEGVPSGKLSQNGKLLTESFTYELCTHKMYIIMQHGVNVLVVNDC